MGNSPVSSSGYIHMRFWTRDYEGLIITHCHLLQHEDGGMMGFYGILPYVDPNNCPNQEDDVTNVIVDVNATTPAPQAMTDFTSSFYTTEEKEADMAAVYDCIIVPVIVCIVKLF